MDYTLIFNSLFLSGFGFAIGTNITSHGYDFCGALAPWDNRLPNNINPIKCSVDNSEDPSAKCVYFQTPSNPGETLNYHFDVDLRAEFTTQIGQKLRYCYILRDYRVEINATVTACSSFNRFELHGAIIISPYDEDDGLDTLILSIFLLISSIAVLIVSRRKYTDVKGRLDEVLGFKRQVEGLQRNMDHNGVTMKKVEEEQRIDVHNHVENNDNFQTKCQANERQDTAGIHSKIPRQSINQKKVNQQ